MSKTKKYVRFTFYWKLLWQSLAIAAVLFQGFNQRDIAFDLFIACSITFLAGMALVQKLFDINLFNANKFDFIADERDAAILEKVNHTIRYNRDNIAYSLLIVGFFVFNSTMESAYKVILFAFFMVTATILPTCEYYYLWNKFDQE
ncbi:hypothetical protein G6R29_03790 [Fructobacillus sp. M2-14]|uniref:DUF2178 domain-containing protein n=1 Tax=Fructobacillus broussonetiae TaxID=2713173 RepID=A0ABS5R010_9LACO|nr:hypothetical protein [Fructobacillus broussonetiae]MBS9338745.1 hypothetical protein [Fructobacillus broussonetiae]